MSVRMRILQHSNSMDIRHLEARYHYLSLFLATTPFPPTAPPVPGAAAFKSPTVPSRCSIRSVWYVHTMLTALARSH